ncbi:MAG: M23 family metallopeptidase [Rikenellaceae bacterium]
MKKILLGLIIASILNLIYAVFMFTPKLRAMQLEKQELTLKYQILQEKISDSKMSLLEIKHRDHKVYRNLFAIDTLQIEGIYTPYPEEKYQQFMGYEFSPLIKKTWLELDLLTRLSYNQSLSLDELQILSRDKEKMATAVPAIWPIERGAVRGSLGLYGRRFHPILKRWMKHYGTDFAAPTGTPIYASGDGVVTKNTHPYYAYGYHVNIDHGFGYKTRYAHMSKILVKVGEKVSRGDTIGLVGSTGRSTGPHLHYEVIFNGEHVDPLNYFRRSMSIDEIERILEAAQMITYEDEH